MVNSDRLCQFEPQLSDENETEMASHSPNFHTIPTRGLRTLTDLICINPNARRIFSVTRTQQHHSQVQNHDHSATVAT
ncbi:hypothetical protein TNCV_2464851 [Trichonephila clavipes]|uniref:Uncharacterized protein n=1 Tax=Trichonephila clavipes TaxID=2585209 RepID=A0A8X6R836_TRICX|nr:hypothetical protein TNCV_2464851 [Trichonephila clavipes]